ncbi:MAG: 23S rRNA (guanosine(2251)-2'-O)-methyltransferase RlmB, partial [Ruminococcus sp.]|nr:23S rRNA (guanosine(2251)-2'-O)-methyltransferase RlmB [Ruminococcus sp.]
MENKREKTDSDIIFGRNPVIEALKSDTCLDTIYMCGNGGSLGIIRRLAKEKGIPVKDVRSEKLDKISGGVSHQGVAAVGA